MTLIIGILGRPNKNDVGTDIVSFNKALVDVIINYDCIPLGIIPPVIDIDKPMIEDEINKMIKMLDLCDGVILQGGLDLYQYDLEALKYIYKKDIPVLGICLGMQTMGIFCGGMLEDIDNHNHLDAEYVHDVEIEDGTFLRKIIGKDKIMVNSRHIQMITNPKNVTISGYANHVIEALEKPESLFFIGVQWHPELLINYDEVSKKIFDNFFATCKFYCHLRKYI